MTRCFGDKAGIPAGIICEPEIRKFSLFPEEEAVVVLGSDGIFEFLSNIEVFKVIEPYLHESKLKIASEKLVFEAAESWKRVTFFFNSLKFYKSRFFFFFKESEV